MLWGRRSERRAEGCFQFFLKTRPVPKRVAGYNPAPLEIGRVPLNAGLSEAPIRLAQAPITAPVGPGGFPGAFGPPFGSPIVIPVTPGIPVVPPVTGPPDGEDPELPLDDDDPELPPDDEEPPVDVPEPGMWLILFTGFVMYGAYLRQSRGQRALVRTRP